jgi:hypothetical protein
MKLPPGWKLYTGLGRIEQDALKAGPPKNLGVPLVKPKPGPTPTYEEVMKAIAAAMAALDAAD